MDEAEELREELYRIRLTNRAGGAVEASADGGASWASLGKVTRPATAAGSATPTITCAPAASVAGVSPDSLLLRLPSAAGRHRSLRIGSRADAVGAHVISTDIPTRGGLFRSLAPSIGTRLRLERAGIAEALPPNWQPRAGDRLVIVVPQPPTKPVTVVIENKEGGDVQLARPDGGVTAIGKVKQPLKGLGRYAGTERSGTGKVVSWVPTAVIVSTSGNSRRPEAEGAEERGGFVIQPAEPELRGSTHPASQLLIQALTVEGEPAPAISPFFGLSAVPSTGDPLDTAQTRVEMRVDDGAWEPLPDLRGGVEPEQMLAALKTALGGDRQPRLGITHLRLTFSPTTPVSLARRILLASTPLQDSVQRGRVNITAAVMGGNVGFVRFYLNGTPVFLTNQPPFVWRWDTTGVPNGEHLIEIRGLDGDLNTLSSVTVKVLVDN